jgi:hypothetical protein
MRMRWVPDGWLSLLLRLLVLVVGAFLGFWLLSGIWTLQLVYLVVLAGVLSIAALLWAVDVIVAKREAQRAAVVGDEYQLPRIGGRYDLGGTTLEVVNYRSRADNWHAEFWQPFKYWVELRVLTGPDRGSLVRKEITGYTYCGSDTVDMSGLRPLAVTDGSDQRERPREQRRGRSLLRPRVGALYELQIDVYRWNAELERTEPWIARGATLRVRDFTEEWIRESYYPECRISADFDVLDRPGAGAEIHLDFDGFTDDEELWSGHLVPFDPVWVLSIGDVGPRTPLEGLFGGALGA